ncbi:MAG TPA: peptidyl-prolyl cis-trans isomerase [Solirubrobacteraceae bacterium]|jgi:foldase protein PrsA|nr:peptidyl-prolyl cis-trans isomerase [Solirubrobacteraceae bacterium]
MPTRWIAALGAVFFAACGLAACGGGIPSDAVVQVNGQPVTKATFDHWLGVAASASSAAAPGQKAAKPVLPEPPAYTACIAHLKAVEPKPAKGQKPKTEGQLKAQCEQQYTALKQQVLGFLISADWVIGEAESQGVKVNDKEVQTRFNQLKKQQFPKEAEFQKFLSTTGQSVSDLLLRVKLSMLTTKIQEKVTKDAKQAVNETAVAKYYNEHKSTYGQPEKRNLRIILTKDEAAAKQAKSEVESGKSFASVAKSKSIDPTSKSNGGELAGVVKGQEQKALSEAAFAAKTGVLSGPVKTPFGYYIFEVKSITAPTQQTLAQVKSSVKQQLASQQQQTALTKFVKEFRKRWEGRTECRVGYVVMDCKSYKAPKTTAIPGAGGATATPTG